MKISKFLAVALLGLIVFNANAQEAPKGFQKGSVTLAGGSTVSGFVKNNMRSDASVTFIEAAGKKKIKYDGSAIEGAELEGTKYICIKGDFFKVLCEGELSYLRKSSDASGKATQVGNEVIFASGTEGSPNDYFIYNRADRQLKLVSKKNLDEVAAASFAGHTAALDKAKSVKEDLAQLKDAVELYNNSHK
jgi:hypothetical protein